MLLLKGALMPPLKLLQDNPDLFMSLIALDKELVFPPVHLAEPDGLLAMGGDLSPERLLLAYRNGIFPWYEGDIILWWCP